MRQGQTIENLDSKLEGNTIVVDCVQYALKDIGRFPHEITLEKLSKLRMATPRTRAKSPNAFFLTALAAKRLPGAVTL